MSIGFLTWFAIGVATALYFIFAWLFWDLNNGYFKQLGRSLIFRIFFSFAWPIIPTFGRIARKKYWQACPDGVRSAGQCTGELERVNDPACACFWQELQVGEPIPDYMAYWYCKLCGKSFNHQMIGYVRKHGHIGESPAWIKFKKSFWHNFL